MTIFKGAENRIVVVWFGIGDIVIGPLTAPKGDEQVGVALFPINRGLGPGRTIDTDNPADVPDDLYELQDAEHPRIEIYLNSLEACRGALVLADALRHAVEVVGTRINEERKAGAPAHVLTAEE